MAAPDSLIDPTLVESMVGLAAGCPLGAFVEIGVYKGGSAYHLAEAARRQGRKLYLYDTFTGIPMQGYDDHHVVGDFRDTSLETVQEAIPDAIILPGVFPGTLIDMGPVAFVHADCDQYESVRAVCRDMPGMMVDGGIILFDDYGILDGATRAVDEAFGTDKYWAPGRKAWVMIIDGKAARPL